MSQQVAPKPYTRVKRDEMTFGILPDFVPATLVGNLKGDARLYSSNEVYDLMMEMDAGFVGMRRSVIDKTEAVRQLILYTLATKLNSDGVLMYAMYQRAAGAEAQLKDGFSIGFGGHVEKKDLMSHFTVDAQGNDVEIEEVPSSFYSTLRSGVRELSEEVLFFGPEDGERPLTQEEMLSYIARGYGFARIGTNSVEALSQEQMEASAIPHETIAVLNTDQPGTGALILAAGASVTDAFRVIYQAEPIRPQVRAQLDSNIVPCGFISDRDVEGKPGHVGNSHLAVVAALQVKSDIDFRVLEEKYTTIGWKTADELRAMHARCEPWTQYLIEHLDALDAFIRAECHTDNTVAKAPTLEELEEKAEAVEAAEQQ
ncbi:hypothetical protein D3C76_25650 [compost metagenome]